jgi:hypothetical protein
MKLPKNQKDELTTWQKANVAKNGPSKRPGWQGNPKANKKYKGMVSALEIKQNKVLAAIVEAQQAAIADMMAGTLLVAQVAGAHAAQHALSKDVLIERAQVAALKLQGILKVGKKT